MKKVILDTNFLIDCAKFRIDFISELKRICDFKYDLFIIDKSIDELSSIKDKNVRLAKDFIKKYSIKIINTKKDMVVDDLILEMIDKDIIVATQDRLFKQKLKQKGIPIVFIRQKKYLSF